MAQYVLKQLKEVIFDDGRDIGYLLKVLNVKSGEFLQIKTIFLCQDYSKVCLVKFVLDQDFFRVIASIGWAKLFGYFELHLIWNQKSLENVPIKFYEPVPARMKEGLCYFYQVVVHLRNGNLFPSFNLLLLNLCPDIEILSFVEQSKSDSFLCRARSKG